MIGSLLEKFSIFVDKVKKEALRQFSGDGRIE